MTRDLFNSEFSGTSEFHWWMGQVVDEKNWNDNHAHKVHKRDDEKGWGYRYKVRIFGRDTKEKYQDTTDDELPMAEVLYPVTAGSGHDGSAQTANLRQGNYVIGFYKDGIDGTEPIIMGVLGNQSQTRLFGGDPDEGFIPRTGFIGLKQTKTASTKNLVLEGPSEGTPPLEENPNPLVGRVAHIDQIKDGAYSHFVPKTRECDGPAGEMQGVQRALKNLLKLVNQIRSESSSFLGAASDLQNAIPQLVNTATQFIANLIKTLIDKIRGYTNNIIDDGIKEVVNLVIPNQRSRFNRVVEKQQDILQCLFNKLIDALIELVKRLVQDAVDDMVDAPMCAAEAMVGGVFSDIIGPIANTVNAVVRAIEAASGGGISVKGGPLDVLNILFGLLGFLSCDEKLDCSMNDQWSFWYGTKEKSDEVSRNIGNLINSLSQSGGGGGGGCNTNAKPCGPPRANFTGDGTGAAGNPVIGPDGSLLAVDMVSGGSGYSAPPSVTMMDQCGFGNGAVTAAQVAPAAGSGAPAGGVTGVPTGTGTDTTTQTGTGTDTTTQTGTGTGLGGLPGFADQTGAGGDQFREVPAGTGTMQGTVTFDDNGNFTGSGTFLTDDGLYTGGGQITGSGTGTGTQSFSGTGDFDNGTFTGEGTAVDLNGNEVGQGTFSGSSIIAPLNNIITADPGEEDLSVTGVIVLDPGVAYLPAPNGFVGANGSVYATPTDTIVGNDVSGFTVLPPFTSISVLPGDTIAAPAGTVIEIYDGEGNITEVINGQGPLSPVTIEVGGSTTTPAPADPITVDPETGAPIVPPEYPTSNGSYPVVLEIGEIVVTNPGVNYQPGDTITITPDRGAVLEPVFDDVGRLQSVNVVSPGLGFAEWPTIRVNSRQGINADMVPVFNVIRVGDLAEDDDRLPEDVQLISVVDCVGKVTRDSRGSIIPNN
jgi:hypothetical protein